MRRDPSFSACLEQETVSLSDSGKRHWTQKSSWHINLPASTSDKLIRNTLNNKITYTNKQECIHHKWNLNDILNFEPLNCYTISPNRSAPDSAGRRNFLNVITVTWLNIMLSINPVNQFSQSIQSISKAQPHSNLTQLISWSYQIMDFFCSGLRSNNTATHSPPLVHGGSRILYNTLYTLYIIVTQFSAVYDTSRGPRAVGGCRDAWLAPMRLSQKRTNEVCSNRSGNCWLKILIKWGTWYPTTLNFYI